ncbi:hypothetical protein ACHAPN_005823 [Verticillium nonalfalfae]
MPLPKATAALYILPAGQFEPSQIRSTPGPPTTLASPAGGGDTRPSQSQTQTPIVHRRGRGRPRKDWGGAASSGMSLSALEQSVSPITHVSTPDSSVAEAAAAPSSCQLNVTDAELLLHFTLHTATSLGDTPTDPWGEAWARNALKVGLAHHFVLHLAMGLAGFHLAHLNPHDHDRQAHYLSAARCHVSSGLAEVARTLPNCDESNCGAVYLASLLVSYCSYAAGPSSPNDLFVCSVGDDTSQHRPALISGTRLLRESYRHDSLFSGLMEPFGPATHFSVDPRPTYLCHGFPRIDWVGPFEELRELIGSLDSSNISVYDQAVDGLEVVYDATYGRGNDTYDGDKSNKIIFGWLYRMEDSFQACLQRKDSVALLIMAHFAILLRTKPFWFLEGWEDHLLHRIAELTDGQFSSWLPWTEGRQKQGLPCEIVDV